VSLPGGNGTGDGMRSATRRVGLLGGTFDPPHIGHLVAGQQTLEQLELDEVWFVVANQPWQKEGSRLITPAEERMRWTEASVEDVPGMVASDVEIRLGGPTYTIDTLAALDAEHPDTEWFVILGADAAAGLDTWHRADELRDVLQVVVVSRPGSHLDPPPGWHITAVQMPALDISSTELRMMVSQGRSIRFLVRDGVAQMVESAGAYRPKP